MWRARVQFHLQDLLGEGSQGRVFKALRRDPVAGLKQNVAVKILHSKTAVSLWKKEFDSLSRVRSPYCVHVLSFERVEGKPALVLELIEGLSLLDLGRTCLLTPALIEEIVAQIQCGLQDLQTQGTFHGDLSPGNVMIDESGRIRLLDFGLANGPGRLTPEFAAPERLDGGGADFAADLYSLGRIEQFLRGVRLNSTQPSSLLYEVAGLRRALDIHPREESRRELGAIVRELRVRRDQRLSTRTLGPRPIPSRRTPWLAALLTTLMVMATSGATPSMRTPYGYLSVRTRDWHYLLIDGVPAGYAPLTMPVPAGSTHTLEWISAAGRGRKKLHLNRDEHIVWGDRDFSH